MVFMVKLLAKPSEAISWIIKGALSPGFVSLCDHSNARIFFSFISFMILTAQANFSQRDSFPHHCRYQEAFIKHSSAGGAGYNKAQLPFSVWSIVLQQQLPHWFCFDQLTMSQLLSPTEQRPESQESTQRLYQGPGELGSVLPDT